MSERERPPYLFPRPSICDGGSTLILATEDWEIGRPELEYEGYLSERESVLLELYRQADSCGKDNILSVPSPGPSTNQGVAVWLAGKVRSRVREDKRGERPFAEPFLISHENVVSAQGSAATHPWIV